MSDRLFHVYEVGCCWHACHGHGPTLAQLARACGLREWECYTLIVGLKRRGLVRGKRARAGR